jgi:hypothetical protein
MPDLPHHTSFAPAASRFAALCDAAASLLGCAFAVAVIAVLAKLAGA